MAGSLKPFQPSSTSLVAATVASGFIALPGNGESCLVTNSGATLAFVAFGTDNTVTASLSASTSVPVLPGQALLLTIGNLVTFGAVILASATGNIYFTRGEGSYR